MSKVRTKNTAPELAVRRALHARGYRFRLHCSELSGKPDIVLPKYKTTVFVHGCFWHGCIQCDRGLRTPKTNPGFWSDKIAMNKARDRRNVMALEGSGWLVIIIWECEVRSPKRLSDSLDAHGLLMRFGN
jgi:DNA mismatch endonuclease (patch repair protein)